MASQFDLAEFLETLPDWEKRNRSKITGQPWSLSCFSSYVKAFGLAKPTPLLIEVVGSKLKGSFSANLASCISMSLKKNVGVFSSPHVLSQTERISVYSGCKKMDIPYEKLADIILGLSGQVKSPLTYFEYFALAGAQFFYEKGLDVSIFEAGLGGRLDATNAFENDYVVLTPIELEHTNHLGNSLDAIAYEKLSVVKPLTKKVYLWQFSDRQFSSARKALARLGINNRRVKSIKTRDLLRAANQVANDILKTERIGCVAICPKEPVGLPGRMEFAHFAGSSLLIDVAHTPFSMEYVLKQMPRAIDTCFFAIAKDKRIEECLRLLSHSMKRIYYVKIEDSRMAGFDDILSVFKSINSKSAIYHINAGHLKDFMQIHKHCLVIGSFRLAELVKRLISKTQTY